MVNLIAFSSHWRVIRLILIFIGPCSGSFDVVMDYVRNRGSTRVFNTYFFRGNSFWKYENQYQRPDHGDPRIINTRDFTGRKVWDGVPGNLDTFVHFFETDLNYPSGIAEHYFFFKGKHDTVVSETIDDISTIYILWSPVVLHSVFRKVL